MRAQLAQRANRLRSSSLNAVPPPSSSADYDHELAKVAASVLYRTPVSSEAGLPIYILNAAALPDIDEIDFDSLLPYVLARLPGEEELISGTEYEVIFFAGGDADRTTGVRKNRPGWGWFIQAYHVLSRAMRKRLQKLYIVHERSWVRILVEMFSTIASPKFRRKIIHVSTLTQLALHIPIESLLIPPSAYLHDRRLSPDIHAPYVSGRRAFGVKQPFPQNSKGDTRLPRVLRETTLFLLMEPNIGTEGLFRIPPHSRLKEILKEAYDRGQKYILWKENDVSLPLPYDNAEQTQAMLNEVDSRDAYGVYLAAGVIKSWYADLRQPIFPQSSYRELRNHFGNPDDVPTLEQLVELISPKSEWSAIPAISRAILIRHLLPLLSIVAEHQAENRMTAENLAVCFAPTLVCGPDQIEDAKISSVIRRILANAIELWTEGLRDACGLDAEAFQRELRPPQNPQDYEDPLEAAPRPRPESDEFSVESPSEEDAGFADSEKQFSGILLQDNTMEPDPPTLPPRPSGSMSTPQTPLSPTGSDDSTLRRKPAPTGTVPPRYSSLLADDAAGTPGAIGSPSTYAATTDRIGSACRTDWSADEKKEDKSSAVLPSPIIPHVIVPKLKPLTSEQIGLNAESYISLPSETTSPSSQLPLYQQQQQQQQQQKEQHQQHQRQQDQPSKRPENHSRAPPGLAEMIGAAAAAEAIKRKPVNAGASRSGSNDSSKPRESPLQSPLQSPGLTSPTTINPEGIRPSLSPQDAEFRKPGFPASSANLSRRASNSSINDSQPSGSRSRGPTIASLARPVYPASASPAQPIGLQRAATIATEPPKHKSMSAGLLKRMTSFEPPPVPQDNPRRLDMKKKSVEDLRRLYEERAGTAQKLVKLGNEKQNGSV